MQQESVVPLNQIQWGYKQLIWLISLSLALHLGINHSGIIEDQFFLFFLFDFIGIPLFLLAIFYGIVEKRNEPLSLKSCSNYLLFLIQYLLLSIACLSIVIAFGFGLGFLFIFAPPLLVLLVPLGAYVAGRWIGEFAYYAAKEYKLIIGSQHLEKILTRFSRIYVPISQSILWVPFASLASNFDIPFDYITIVNILILAFILSITLKRQ